MGSPNQAPPHLPLPNAYTASTVKMGQRGGAAATGVSSIVFPNLQKKSPRVREDQWIYTYTMSISICLG